MCLKDEMVQTRGGWYCAGIVLRGEELLVIHTTGEMEYPGGGTRPIDMIKFPGGSMKVDENRHDRTPLETLKTEFAEEVFKNGSGEILSWEPVIKIPARGHDKYWALVEIDAELRTEPLREPESKGERGRKYREVLNPPEFMTASALAQVIFPSHAPALEKVCHEHAMESQDFIYALNYLKDRKLIK